MIAEALALYAKATVRTFEGRENTVGASEIGQCARRVFFAKNAGDFVYGAASDEDYVEAWGAALRGCLIEDHFWTPALRTRFGNKLLYAGDEQKTFVLGFTSATPDGLLMSWGNSASATSAAMAALWLKARPLIRASDWTTGSRNMPSRHKRSSASSVN